MFHFSSTVFAGNTFRSDKYLGTLEIGSETHADIHAQCPLLLSDFNRNWLCQQFFLNFLKTRPAIIDMRTNRRIFATFRSERTRNQMVWCSSIDLDLSTDRIPAKQPTNSTEVFWGIYHSVQANTGIVPWHNLICKHPVCYYDIIGYLLTFNTSFDFQVFLFLAMATCFDISSPPDFHTATHIQTLYTASPQIQYNQHYNHWFSAEEFTNFKGFNNTIIPPNRI
jgi:hypothetical protein